MKYHTWPRIPHGKVTKTQLNITNKDQEVSPFTAGDPKAAMKWRESMTNTRQTKQMIHKRSTALERSVKLFMEGLNQIQGANLGRGHNKKKRCWHVEHLLQNKHFFHKQFDWNNNIKDTQRGYFFNVCPFPNGICAQRSSKHQWNVHYSSYPFYTSNLPYRNLWSYDSIK